MTLLSCIPALRACPPGRHIPGIHQAGTRGHASLIWPTPSYAKAAPNSQENACGECAKLRPGCVTLDSLKRGRGQCLTVSKPHSVCGLVTCTNSSRPDHRAKRGPGASLLQLFVASDVADAGRLDRGSINTRERHIATGGARQRAGGTSAVQRPRHTAKAATRGGPAVSAIRQLPDR